MSAPGCGHAVCQDSHLPPRPSIRCRSLGSSGLWSCVTSTALMTLSEGSSLTPSTTDESPTCATYMRSPRITTTLAVVPDVLGRPVMVLGHSAVRAGGDRMYVYMLGQSVQSCRQCMMAKFWKAIKHNTILNNLRLHNSFAILNQNNFHYVQNNTNVLLSLPTSTAQRMHKKLMYMKLPWCVYPSNCMTQTKMLTMQNLLSSALPGKFENTRGQAVRGAVDNLGETGDFTGDWTATFVLIRTERPKKSNVT